MREKRRYLLVLCTLDIADGAEKAFESGLCAAMQKEIGNRYFRANPRVVRFVDARTFVLTVGLDGYRDAIVASAFVKRINDLEVGLYTLRSSGTIRALLSNVAQKKQRCNKR